MHQLLGQRWRGVLQKKSGIINLKYKVWILRHFICNFQQQVITKYLQVQRKFKLYIRFTLYKYRIKHVGMSRATLRADCLTRGQPVAVFSKAAVGGHRNNGRHGRIDLLNLSRVCNSSSSVQAKYIFLYLCFLVFRSEISVLIQYVILQIHVASSRLPFDS